MLIQVTLRNVIERNLAPGDMQIWWRWNSRESETRKALMNLSAAGAAVLAP
jgi:hypothetical protein